MGIFLNRTSNTEGFQLTVGYQHKFPFFAYVHRLCLVVPVGPPYAMPLVGALFLASGLKKSLEPGSSCRACSSSNLS